MMTVLPAEVSALLDDLLSGIRLALPHNLVGVYLRGSLAMGDFAPETSDLDLLTVTKRVVNNEEFVALSDLHTRLAVANPWGKRLEMAYVDRAALRRFTPGQVHATLYQGEALRWAPHGTNWILERWTVREHGLALTGPAPKTLIDPITPDEIRAAVRDRLPDWAEWANQPDDPDWSLPRRHKLYVVATMCRALYTLASGTISSKQEAIIWALHALPEPWRSLVERSQAWRTDDTVDPTIVPEVRAFVLWAAEQGALCEIRLPPAVSLSG